MPDRDVDELARPIVNNCEDPLGNGYRVAFKRRTVPSVVLRLMVIKRAIEGWTEEIDGCELDFAMKAICKSGPSKANVRAPLDNHR